jgi:phospholipase D1/2
VSPRSQLASSRVALKRPPIAQPGRNCWRVERADRMFCIQDAAEYFRLVRRAMLNAEHSIFTLGWDTSGRTDLLPGEHPPDGPARLDELLAHVARRRRTLQCYVLTWDYGIVHLLERDPFTRWRLDWQMPSNVTFAFDDHHAVGGCHHQKVVVVDDQLAFVGGIDLTGHRWDTSAHRVDEPSRISLDGDAYPPYHEVQAMVSGPAAAAFGALARDRWRALGADRLPPVSPSPRDLWPSDVQPDLAGAPVAIARTMPPLDERPAVRECETLYVDSIARAQQTIYIESQYFSDSRLAEALAARLQDPDGPEVIVVMPKCCEGWLEQKTMGALRDQVSRQMIAADAYKRLRLVYPAASQSRDVPTFVHSKVMFVDDQLARIGSANLSRRSMGVDTECDLAVDAGGDAALGGGILRMRNRLIAEHLGMPPGDLARELEAGRSLRAIIDSHAGADRTLVRVPVPVDPEPLSAALVAAADPDQPIGAELAVRAVLAGQRELVARRTAPARARLTAVAVIALGILVVVFGAPLSSAWREGRTQAGAAALLLIVVGVALRTWLFARRAARIGAHHRREAEFG